MITQEDTATQLTDGDDEPVTSKGGDARAEAKANGDGTNDIKVSSPTDGNGVVAAPQE